MAIYYLKVDSISRSAGRSATAAAAYRAGEKIVDRRSGEVHDYRRKAGVEHAEIVLPKTAWAWAQNRSELWNRAEEAERRKNSCVAREIKLALPAELDAEQRKELALDFAKELVYRHHIAVDVAIHAPDKGGSELNYHAHLLMTTRRVGPEGMAEKSREWDNRYPKDDPDPAKRIEADQTAPYQVEHCRARWAALANERLAEHGVQIDHRSYARQGVDKVAQQHMGPEATAMQRRHDRRVDAGMAAPEDSPVRNERFPEWAADEHAAARDEVERVGAMSQKEIGAEIERLKAAPEWVENREKAEAGLVGEAARSEKAEAKNEASYLAAEAGVAKWHEKHRIQSFFVRRGFMQPKALAGLEEKREASREAWLESRDQFLGAEGALASHEKETKGMLADHRRRFAPELALLEGEARLREESRELDAIAEEMEIEQQVDRAAEGEIERPGELEDSRALDAIAEDMELERQAEREREREAGRPAASGEGKSLRDYPREPPESVRRRPRRGQAGRAAPARPPPETRPPETPKPEGAERARMGIAKVKADDYGPENYSPELRAQIDEAKDKKAQEEEKARLAKQARKQEKWEEEQERAKAPPAKPEPEAPVRQHYHAHEIPLAGYEQEQEQEAPKQETDAPKQETPKQQATSPRARARTLTPRERALERRRREALTARRKEIRDEFTKKERQEQRDALRVIEGPVARAHAQEIFDGAPDGDELREVLAQLEDKNLRSRVKYAARTIEESNAALAQEGAERARRDREDDHGHGR